MLNNTGVERLLPAAGAALIALAVLVAQFRMNDTWATGVLALVVVIPAFAIVALALATDDDAVRAVLLATGLALTAVSLYRVFEVLGSDDPLAGNGVTTFGLLLAAAIAGGLAARTGSALCLLAALLALGGSVLAGVLWLFEPEDDDVFRVILVVFAIAYALVAMRLPAGRHRDIVVDAAGAGVLGLAYITGGLFFFGEGDVAWGWEAVMLVGAIGLGAYAAITRAPGPGLQALLVAFAFVTTVGFAQTEGEFGDEVSVSLGGWPIALLVAGVAAFGLGALMTSRSD